MRISHPKEDRAFAVIIALVAVTVLTILAGAFAYAMKVETKLAANTNNDEEFYWIGRGGVERACWWLGVEGGQPYSTLQQYWAGGPGDGPETNSILNGESLNDFPIGDGTVSLKMVELESKININTADGPLLQNVLSQQGADAGAISEVSDSILDWIDPDDNTRPAGAESDYYLGLTPSYYAKNAPMDSTEELLLVKGVTHKMYYNDSVSSPSGHKLGFGHEPGQEPDYAFALKDVFTAYSSGKINLLTAGDTVLGLIPGLDTAAAQQVEAARNSEPPAHSIQQLLAQAGLSPQAAQQIMNYVTIIGNTYEIHATATIGQLSHEYTAIVYRNGPNVHVVSFYRSH
ncbi:MAG TPA: general secretion pathway protein GspK [Candidatus Acidoferrales bacterium]|nr:general secretion pathway protein GspK [Candidatus Acidoferrales bacterium]